MAKQQIMQNNIYARNEIRPKTQIRTCTDTRAICLPAAAVRFTNKQDVKNTNEDLTFIRFINIRKEIPPKKRKINEHRRNEQTIVD